MTRDFMNDFMNPFTFEGIVLAQSWQDDVVDAEIDFYSELHRTYDITAENNENY